jgi:hypothetical protein
MLIAAVLNGYAYTQGGLVTLYGWDASRFNLAPATAAQRFSAALQAVWS